MIPVSVAIITKNEERNIEEALRSVREFNDIVVVDDFSNDHTVEICRKYTDRIYQHPWEGYAKQKQRAINYAREEWVLVLDADERVTPRLQEEISRKIRSTSCNGFYIPRKNFFLGKWIRHSGWWPDYTLRLFRKSHARMEERKVHERIIVDGAVGYLESPMEHYTYRTISEYIKKMDIYSTLAAEELKGSSIKWPLLSMIFNPPFTFIKMYFLRQGFRDGIHGLILATFYSFYTFLKYVKLWESRNR